MYPPPQHTYVSSHVYTTIHDLSGDICMLTCILLLNIHMSPHTSCMRPTCICTRAQYVCLFATHICVHTRSIHKSTRVQYGYVYVYVVYMCISWQLIDALDIPMYSRSKHMSTRLRHTYFPRFPQYTHMYSRSISTSIST